MKDKKSDHRVAIINDGRPLPSMWTNLEKEKAIEHPLSVVTDKRSYKPAKILPNVVSLQSHWMGYEIDTAEAWKIYQIKKETFKEKNIVPLKLDQRYSGDASIKTTIKSSAETIKKVTAPAAPAANTTADSNVYSDGECELIIGMDSGATAGVRKVYCESMIVMIRAMKQYPASMDKSERWKLIAEAVPGKTKKECIMRVKWIAEQVFVSLSVFIR